VIGAGSWGTALAEVFSQAGQDVVVYARDVGLSDMINKTHENKTYLDGYPLSASLRATSDLKTAVDHADILLMVTPTQYVRSVLEEMKDYIPKTMPIISCAKGIEITTGKILSDVTREILPDNPYGRRACARLSS
jgi:glycerol-3-phosphate dehydrogenase (NAD(P)+)